MMSRSIFLSSAQCKNDLTKIPMNDFQTRSKQKRKKKQPPDDHQWLTPNEIPLLQNSVCCFGSVSISGATKKQNVCRNKKKIEKTANKNITTTPEVKRQHKTHAHNISTAVMTHKLCARKQATITKQTKKKKRSCKCDKTLNVAAFAFTNRTTHDEYHRILHRLATNNNNNFPFHSVGKLCLATTNERARIETFSMCPMFAIEKLNVLS